MILFPDNQPCRPMLESTIAQPFCDCRISLTYFGAKLESIINGFNTIVNI
jgi:hypothetical protein